MNEEKKRGGAVRLIVKIVLGLLAVVIIAVLAMPLWLGPVARRVANSVVPGITGTGFNLGELSINPYSGKVHVGDMQLANPTNFSEKNAVDLKKLDVDVAPMSAFGRKFVIESIELDGLEVFSTLTADNFRQIAANASGSGAQETPAEGAEASETPPAEAPTETASAEPAEEQPAKGLEIGRITLKNITLKYGPIPLKIPMAIEITDIGKDSENGATPEEVGRTVYEKVMSAAGGLGGKLGDLGSGALDAVKGDLGGAADSLKGAADSLKDAAKAVDVEGAKDALKSAGDGLKNLFK